MLLESVPNVSLGPQDEAIEPVLERVRSATSPGCRLLDIHTDRDHRRTVLTLAGAPVPLLDVLAALQDALVEHASLEGHEGVHPRVGMLDVVPFVALDAPRSEAHRAAEAAMRRLAGADVPVYAYADLARRSRTRRLADVRRAVADASLGDPAPVAPDRGPRELHPTMGTTCVGVRDLLVAYNVVLDTTDLAAGREIARAIRASSGGLPGVQALAFRLASQGDRVQVSANITDVNQRSIADVYRAVERAADERAIAVREGELVGLAPRRGLPKNPSEMGLGTPPVSLEEALDDAGYTLDEVQ